MVYLWVPIYWIAFILLVIAAFLVAITEFIREKLFNLVDSIGNRLESARYAHEIPQDDASTLESGSAK